MKMKEAIEKVLEGKGKRKFTQTFEMIINFTRVNFSKADQRIDLAVPLPKGRGKPVKVAVFAETQAGLDAKNAGADVVYSSEDIVSLAADKKKLIKIANEYVFVAEPKLMALAGKHLGQVLGTRGKLPKPVVGKTMQQAIDDARKTVIIKTKGKYLPTLQCPIGSETMDPDDIAENANAVLNALTHKVQKQNIKNVFFKLSMGPIVKVDI